MLTRREFVQAAGAASLGAATAECPANFRTGDSEPKYLGRPAPFWLGRLADRSTVEYDPLAAPDEAPRERVYEAVAAFGESVVPALRRLLLRGREPGRSGALRVLSRVGPLGESVLIDAARDPRGNLRAAALSTLAHAFPDSAKLNDLLLAALDDDVPEVRHQAAHALWFVSTDRKPILAKALRSKDAVVRSSAVSQILRIDPAATFAMPLLLASLNDPSIEVRSAAVEGLFYFQPVDPRVVPAVTRLIQEGNHALASYLPFAGETGFAEALQLLTDNDVVKRAAAASALAKFVCGDTSDSPNSSRPLPTAQASALLLACRNAVLDHDLAVSVAARQISECLTLRGYHETRVSTRQFED